MNCHSILHGVYVGLVSCVPDARIEVHPIAAAFVETQEITIRVDPDAAGAYLAASENERRKFDLLLSLRLQDVTQGGTSLESVMREISRGAQERGLTPEILQTLLNDE
jgi:hypothetical protein